jgi:dTDP-4-dehydrorhamnose 3,5-epimerase
MNVIPSKLEGVQIVEPHVFADARGHFVETYHAERYAMHGIPKWFVQDNISFSVKNVLRGLHYQLGQPQGKLVMVLSGEIFDVAVDIRTGSPTFGQWAGVTLSAENHRQIYIPEGFAHGFCVMSDAAQVLYKCTAFYAPKEERGILWNDPRLGIDWPVAKPILSEKDSRYPTLDEMTAESLPRWGFE